nr:hypothetical protein [Tanacetum cinerariifolium]
MKQPFFTPAPAGLTPEQLSARQERERSATNSVATLMSNGPAPSPESLALIQRYVDGRNRFLIASSGAPQPAGRYPGRALRPGAPEADSPEAVRGSVPVGRRNPRRPRVSGPQAHLPRAPGCPAKSAAAQGNVSADNQPGPWRGGRAAARPQPGPAAGSALARDAGHGCPARAGGNRLPGDGRGGQHAGSRQLRAGCGR